MLRCRRCRKEIINSTSLLAVSQKFSPFSYWVLVVLFYVCTQLHNFFFFLNFVKVIKTKLFFRIWNSQGVIRQLFESVVYFQKTTFFSPWNCLSLMWKGEDTDESPATVCSIWHVNVDALPEWIMTSVHQVSVSTEKCKCFAVWQGHHNLVHYKHRILESNAQNCFIFYTLTAIFFVLSVMTKNCVIACRAFI